MRPVDSWIDRFVFQHPRFGIPRLMLYVTAGNLIVFFFNLFSDGAFSAMLTFSRYFILRGEIWRLFTFVFVPLFSGGRYILLFALSTYLYYSIGTALEREWGCAKFTLFYLMGVAFNILTGFLAGDTTMHYVNQSLFFAFATLYPDMQFIFFFFPVKVKWLAWLDAALIALDLVEMAMGGYWLAMLLPVVALLNYLLFFYSHIKELLTRGRARARYQRGRTAVDFRAAQRKARETKGYMHKCAVCGKTDADDPQMEFRYCSKCDGYYCYCMEHINNHVHVKN